MNRMILASLAAVASSSLAAETVPVRITGPWEVTVGPGVLRTGNLPPVTIKASVLTVPKQEAISVEKEKYPRLRDFDEKAAGWRRGERLRALITQECSAAGALIPSTVRVQGVEGQEWREGTDYRVEGFWGTIGRAEGSAIGVDVPVRVSYAYYPNRLHALAVSREGTVRLIEGSPGVGIQLPPEMAAGETLLATVWLSGEVTELSEANLYFVDSSPRPVSEWQGAAEKLCPKTMAKLRRGEPVCIVAWGDSVTHGGGVGGNGEKWYQQQFLTRLRERFPKSEITLYTAAWPGGNSRGYMAAPAGGKYDFKRDVLDPKPDLVTIEFVNDSGLQGEALDAHYMKILEAIQGNGSEIIFITPHFVRPDWMRVDNLKFDEDPRPYVKDLRGFARQHSVAVADASRLWGHLWREGIPYMTLEGNSINHPDIRGHELFADALIDVFPLR